MPQTRLLRDAAHWRNLSSGAALALAAVLAMPVHATEAVEAEETIVAHGYSFYGDLSYPEDFEHYTYVNPDAPRGGEISVWAPGTFDSMNPYTRRGRAGRSRLVLLRKPARDVGPVRRLRARGCLRRVLRAAGAFGRIPAVEGLGDLPHAPRGAVFRRHAADRA
jgi:hypothetical protein